MFLPSRQVDPHAVCADCDRPLHKLLAGRSYAGSLCGCNPLTTETPLLRFKPVGNQISYPLAAFLCKKHEALPREVVQNHIKELQEILLEHGQYEDSLKPGSASN